MAALLGALKGMGRTALLLVALLALPAVAWGVALWAEGAFGVGFATAFVGALVLELLLALGALLGLAEEVQKQHAEALDEVAPEP